VNEIQILFHEEMEKTNHFSEIRLDSLGMKQRDEQLRGIEINVKLILDQMSQAKFLKEELRKFTMELDDAGYEKVDQIYAIVNQIRETKNMGDGANSVRELMQQLDLRSWLSIRSERSKELHGKLGSALARLTKAVNNVWKQIQDLKEHQYGTPSVDKAEL
jgi:hypothetical protein